MNETQLAQQVQQLLEEYDRLSEELGDEDAAWGQVKQNYAPVVVQEFSDLFVSLPAPTEPGIVVDAADVRLDKGAAKGAKGKGRSRKKKNCKKQSCGYTCIALNKTCRITEPMSKGDKAKTRSLKEKSTTGGTPSRNRKASTGGATPAPTKPLDLNRNIDLTDWHQVRDLGRDFASRFITDADLQYQKSGDDARNKLNQIETSFLAATSSARRGELFRERNKVLEEQQNAIVQGRRQIEAKSQALRDELIKLGGVDRATAQSYVDRTLIGAKVERGYPQIREDLLDFYQITGRRVEQSVPDGIAATDKGRAFFNPSNRTVYLLESDEVVPQNRNIYRLDIFHELGHNLEINAGITEASRGWMYSRATSTTPVRLSEITGNKGFRDNEVALPGNYFSPYVSKVYPGASFTEVISTGIEQLATPGTIAAFALGDLDHLHFTLGVLLASGN